MSSREFAEWQAYYDIEPWGNDWLQTGLIVSSNVNLWNKRKYRPEQFMPKPSIQARRSPEELEAIMMQWGRMYNAAHEARQARKKQEK